MTFANIRVLAALAFATLVSACNSPIVMVPREGVEPTYGALYNQPVPVQPVGLREHLASVRPHALGVCSIHIRGLPTMPLL